MNILPPEMLVAILIKLDMNSMLTCRLVSKKWKFVIENNMMIKNLSVKHPDDLSPTQRYHFTFRPTSKDILFVTENMNFLEAEFFRTKILNNLRSLFITGSIYTCDDLNSVNRYTKLEHLHIESLELSQSGTINLLKLQYFTIDKFRGPRLLLSTPLLHSFKIQFGYSKIIFNYEEKIKSLSLFELKNDVTKFRNLERLFLNHIQNADHFLAYLLRKLPKLRELHSDSSNLIRKDIVYNIILDKEALERSDFRFYYCGIRIDNLKDLHELTFTDGYYLKRIDDHLITRHYSKLTYYMPGIHFLNYCDLVNHFKGKIETNFHDRFFAIDEIMIIKKVEDQEQFIEFIKKYPYLSALHLSEECLDQSFYDQLPAICSNIKKLSATGYVANLDFIFNFKIIENLFLHIRVTYDLVAKALDCLTQLKCFKFIIDNVYVQIESRKCNHTIMIGNDTIRRFESRAELLSFLQNLMRHFDSDC